MLPPSTATCWRWLTDDELRIEGLKSELESALRVLTLTVGDARPVEESAWWLCANHARFIIDHPLLISETRVISIARNAGTPPTGGTWEQWFDRVRGEWFKLVPEIQAYIDEVKRK
jgi:hypothetical protein